MYTYALLDFAAKYPLKLQHTIVMETGGMKGRQKEITRKELYQRLKESFGLKTVHSEYGMTELLSQAYAIDGNFKSPPWMKILLRDETDPFEIYENRPDAPSVSGVINVVDLANIFPYPSVFENPILWASRQIPSNPLHLHQDV